MKHPHAQSVVLASSAVAYSILERLAVLFLVPVLTPYCAHAQLVVCLFGCETRLGW
jgi:hypothetical protein